MPQKVQPVSITKTMELKYISYCEKYKSHKVKLGIERTAFWLWSRLYKLGCQPSHSHSTYTDRNITEQWELNHFFILTLNFIDAFYFVHHLIASLYYYGFPNESIDLLFILLNIFVLGRKI